MRKDFALAEGAMHIDTSNNIHQLAFTLAEVLITLGIIGVVAALTIPGLIVDSRKEATAANVKKFYNVINNAVQFAVADNGDVFEWMGEIKNLSYNENLEFLQQYFLPYLKYTRYDNCYDNAVCVYMVGSGMFAFRYDSNGGDFFYFVNGKQEWNTRNAFSFQFNKIDGNATSGNAVERQDVKTAVEPYVFEWNGRYEDLTNNSTRGCRKENQVRGTYCTKLIQLNGWKIPKDYPW